MARKRFDLEKANSSDYLGFEAMPWLTHDLAHNYIAGAEYKHVIVDVNSSEHISTTT
jgi:hypothetical protein